MNLLVARELELGPVWGRSHMLLDFMLLGADGRYDSDNEDPGHCVLGISKGTSAYLSGP